MKHQMSRQGLCNIVWCECFDQLLTCLKRIRSDEGPAFLLRTKANLDGDCEVLGGLFIAIESYGKDIMEKSWPIFFYDEN